MKISAVTYFVSLAFFASTSLALNESQRLTRIFQNIKTAQTKVLQNNPADRTQFFEAWASSRTNYLNLNHFLEHEAHDNSILYDTALCPLVNDMLTTQDNFVAASVRAAAPSDTTSKQRVYSVCIYFARSYLDVAARAQAELQCAGADFELGSRETAIAQSCGDPQ